jgi:hypothetical protein
MGPGKYEDAGKSQSVLMMINPMIYLGRGAEGGGAVYRVGVGGAGAWCLAPLRARRGGATAGRRTAAASRGGAGRSFGAGCGSADVSAGCPAAGSSWPPHCPTSAYLMVSVYIFMFSSASHAMRRPCRVLGALLTD